jgi:hypothetical protein
MESSGVWESVKEISPGGRDPELGILPTLDLPPRFQCNKRYAVVSPPRRPAPAYDTAPEREENSAPALRGIEIARQMVFLSCTTAKIRLDPTHAQPFAQAEPFRCTRTPSHYSQNNA